MTRFEIIEKRRELAAVAQRLVDRVPAARAAGDRELALDLLEAASILGAIAAGPDELIVMAADEPLERTPATRRTGT